MTTSRWLIAAFWTIMIVVGVGYALKYAMEPAAPPPPEQHWFPPPLPTPNGPAENADLKMTHFITTPDATNTSFSAAVTIQNFGKKKATEIQVVIQPYVGTRDTNSSQPGPDEMPSHKEGDPMSYVTQTITFDDLKPGESETKTLQFPMRSDADPGNTHSFTPKFTFQSVNP